MNSKTFNFIAPLFYTGYLGAGLIATALLACAQLSGSAGLFLFIANDVLTNLDYALFVIAFPLALGIGYLAALFFLRLPSVDYLNTVMTINAACFAILGLTLSALRLNLLSRTVFLSEFFLSLCLLITFYILRNRLIPRKVALLPGIALESFERHPAIIAEQVSQTELADRRFHAVVGDLRDQPDDDQIRMLSELAKRKITVFDANLFIERLWGRVPLDHLTPVEIETFIPPVLYSQIKRILELLLVILVSPLSLLLGIFIASAIRLDSKGPVFFLQRRVGQSGSTFVMWKFRSMVHSSESVSRFAKKKDSRITRVGAFLRRSRLDELPQLWNVVKGEMSLIGPRPEQENFVERYRERIPFFDFRHTVPPGITGWAQVMYGYADSDERARAKLEFDFYYIKRMSAWIDILVLIKTVRTIVLGIGAR
jgi:UDP-GalNAc:undecaprenyl-phosphate GalNAc-1-phosphate transferase